MSANRSCYAGGSIYVVVDTGAHARHHGSAPGTELRSAGNSNAPARGVGEHLRPELALGTAAGQQYLFTLFGHVLIGVEHGESHSLIDGPEEMGASVLYAEAKELGASGGVDEG